MTCLHRYSTQAADRVMAAQALPLSSSGRQLTTSIARGRYVGYVGYVQRHNNKQVRLSICCKRDRYLQGCQYTFTHGRRMGNIP